MAVFIPRPVSRPSLLRAAACALSLLLVSCGRPASVPPRAGPALKVEMGKQARLDPDAALRCFVHGQFVGMQTPGQCAQKNGVATGALDVGLDQSGSLAAGASDTPLQPLANTQAGDAGPAVPDSAETDRQGDSSAIARIEPDAVGEQIDWPRADCLRFGRNGWRGAGQEMTLGACAHQLFDGRCVAPGQEIYGRWGTQTLRLAPGRIEISDDNREFRTLARQEPDACTPSAQ